MNFITRKANLDTDIPALTELTIQLGYPTDSNTLKERLLKIQQFDHYSTWVVEINSKVVAYTGLVEQWCWEYSDAQIRIQVFVVDKTMRNIGIGNALIHAIEEYALSKDIQRIVVSSGNRPERQNAHRFYQKKGFMINNTGFVKNIINATK